LSYATHKINACFIPDQPGQLELALHPDVAVGVAGGLLEVDEAEVGATVEARQLHALEILDGSPEHAEANAGNPVEQVGLVGLWVPVTPDALIEASILLARATGSGVGPGAYVAQKGSAAAEDLMNALKQLSWLHPAWTAEERHSAAATTDNNPDCIFSDQERLNFNV
jgi:hypothetical protein